MVGLYADAHITCLLLDDRHGHRASRTNRSDPVVKITQLAFPLKMGRDRPKSLDNLSQDLIAVGANVMQVVALAISGGGGSITVCAGSLFWGDDDCRSCPAGGGAGFTCRAINA